ncbi:MAG: hypothetical protein N2C14_21780, partial [Planctomycetales bacterium]
PQLHGAILGGAIGFALGDWVSPILTVGDPPSSFWQQLAVNLFMGAFGGLLVGVLLECLAGKRDSADDD